jgi:hypothetical protein
MLLTTSLKGTDNAVGRCYSGPQKASNIIQGRNGIKGLSFTFRLFAFRVGRSYVNGTFNQSLIEALKLCGMSYLLRNRGKE